MPLDLRLHVMCDSSMGLLASPGLQLIINGKSDARHLATESESSRRHSFKPLGISKQAHWNSLWKGGKWTKNMKQIETGYQWYDLLAKAWKDCGNLAWIVPRPSSACIRAAVMLQGLTGPDPCLSYCQCFGPKWRRYIEDTSTSLSSHKQMLQLDTRLRRRIKLEIKLWCNRFIYCLTSAAEKELSDSKSKCWAWNLLAAQEITL